MSAPIREETVEELRLRLERTEREAAARQRQPISQPPDKIDSKTG